MARLRKTDQNADLGLRARVRANVAARVALYGHVPGNPYVSELANLDAGRPVTVHGWQIRGAQGVERNGVYALDAAGNLTPAELDRR